MPDQTPIVRAFQLARGGQCKRMEDLRRQLKAEGYDGVEQHFSSGALKKQLAAAMASAG